MNILFDVLPGLIQTLHSELWRTDLEHTVIFDTSFTYGTLPKVGEIWDCKKMNDAPHHEDFKHPLNRGDRHMVICLHWKVVSELDRDESSLFSDMLERFG